MIKYNYYEIYYIYTVAETEVRQRWNISDPWKKEKKEKK